MVDELLREDAGIPPMPKRPPPGAPQAGASASTARGAGAEPSPEVEVPEEVQAAHKRCPPVDSIKVPSVTSV
jgi:hypothetical protein